jgi:peptidoglycan/LPS O-acetylase OafA/YrhL
MALAVASVWWSEYRKEPVVLGRRWVPTVSWAVALCAFWAVSTQTGLPRVPIYLLTFGQVLARQWLYAAFAFFLLIPAVFGQQDEGWIRRLLRSRLMVALGLISYGIYLWHETWMLKVLDWMHRPLFQTSFLTLTVWVLVLSVLSAGASYVFIEQPFQRLGRRRQRAQVVPRRARQVAGPPLTVDGHQPGGLPVRAGPAGP